MSDYDVIVIGSGAGGGTLVAPPRPVRQARAAARARRLAAARAAELAGPRRVRRQPLRVRGHVVRRATARRSSRRCTTASAAPRSSTAPRCTGCARRTSASCATTTGSRRPGRSTTPRWSPTTRSPSSSTRSTARAARIRPSRRRRAPYPFPAVSHEPRIQQLSDDLEAAGLRPVPRAVRRPAGRGRHAAQPLRALRHLRRLPVPGAREVRRRGARRAAGARARQRDADDERRGGAARDERRTARAVTGVVVDHAGERETFTGDLVVVSCGAANSARLLLASATDAHPDGLANGSGQVGRNYMFHNSQAVLALSKEENPTVFQKTLGLNDFYFGSPDFEFPLGQHPDGREVLGGDVPRREADPDPPRAGAHARARSRGTRSTSGSRRRISRAPRTASRCATTASVRLSYTPTNEVPKAAPAARAQVDAGASRHAPRPPGPAARVPQERHPGGGLRAPGGHLPLRRPIPPTSVLEHGLPRARGRQPLRRRHELLPEHRRGEPGADRDGQRAARRRPPARAHGRGPRGSGSPSMSPDDGERPAARDRRRRRLRRRRLREAARAARRACASR